MTEAGWLSGTDPVPMLEQVYAMANDRKLRLWACACVHRIEQFIPDGLGRQVLTLVEEFVEGRVDERELRLIADHFYPCGQYDARYDHPATRAAHAPLYLERVGQAASYAVRCLKHNVRATERAAQAALLRDIFGDPFRPVDIDAGCRVWNGSTVVRLAQAIYDERAFDRLPILADALEDAGCTAPEVFSHCRGGGEHARGCWVIDLLLGKS
jgi:hypothetical protein